MRPKRPDSAKTQMTKQTLDSEPSKRELNASKFSQTFSSGVNSVYDKPDDFKQYVAEKDKDPKFKHLKSKLEVIQEKSAKGLDESKTSFKPFEKKKEKTVEKATKKVEEKPDEQLSLSRGFAEKNKQKMNSLKMMMANQEKEDKTKPKIKFDSFKLNVPGDKKEQKKQTKQQSKKEDTSATSTAREVQQKPEKKDKSKKVKQAQTRERQQRNLNLERYVSEIQSRNMQIFPSNYDQMLSLHPDNVEDIQKINLDDFLNEPTEGDYENIKKKIRKLDEQLENESVASESIDLQLIIGDDDQDYEEEKSRAEEQSYLGSMSASELRKRNAFITEILNGKLSKQNIDQLEEIDRSAMRIHKIEYEKEEEEIEFTEINMVKRQNNRLLERNMVEASGQIYRDCDYLSEEHKRRLEELLNSDTIESPFEFDDLQRMKHRRIDEGIKMYREMAGSEDIEEEVINEDSLPKDPELRKQAEKKVLREKMTSINQRLSDVDKVVVTKAKIDSLVKKYEHTRASATYQSLCEQNRRKFDDEFQRIKDASAMVAQIGKKENLDEVIEQIEKQYRQLEEQLKQMAEMDHKELTRMKKDRLRRKLIEVQNVQKLNEDLQHEIEQMERINNQVKEQIKLYDQIQSVELIPMQCAGYKQNESVEDIDAWITRQMQLKENENSQNN